LFSTASIAPAGGGFILSVSNHGTPLGMKWANKSIKKGVKKSLHIAKFRRKIANNYSDNSPYLCAVNRG